VFCRSRLEILEKVLRVILQITQSHRRGRERATKRFLHARVVGKECYLEESKCVQVCSSFEESKSFVFDGRLDVLVVAKVL